jgi:hypothetical protein
MFFSSRPAGNTLSVVLIFVQVATVTLLPVLMTTDEYCLICVPANTMLPRDSVVGIATRYNLERPRIEPACGRRFPHPSRPGLKALPASCTNGYQEIPGGKAAGGGVNLPPLSSAGVTTSPLCLHGIL